MVGFNINKIPPEQIYIMPAKEVFSILFCPLFKEIINCCMQFLCIHAL